MTRASGPARALLALLALLAGTVPVAAEDVSAAPRAAMAEAMAKMMEAMGFLGPALPGSMPSPVSGVMPGMMPTPLPGNMPVTADPKSLMDQGLEKGGAALQQMTEGMKMPDSAGSFMPWATPSRLDGVWEGRNGELLIVQGNRFRIYPGASHYVDGYIQLQGDRLALYNPGNEHIRPFEFAESEGRLAMRDPSGTLFLYRRLWLDQPTTESAATPQGTEQRAK